MSAPIHALVLTSIAIAIFALVMAWGWTAMVERRLQALEAKTGTDSGTGSVSPSDT